MRAPFVLLLLLLPLAGAQAEPKCLYSTTAQREQSGHWVVAAAQWCDEPRAGRHSESVRVTQGHPADNDTATLASANLTHQRWGERDGAFDVREHLRLQAGEFRVETWYNSTRDAAGYTRCALYANLTHARGSAVLRQPMPLCVPQELLLP